MSLSKSKFLSYIRRGLSTKVTPGKSFRVNFQLATTYKKGDQSYVKTTADQLGGQGDAPGISPEFTLRHAGQVVSLDSRTISRVVPAQNSKDYNPNNLVYAEFREPDILWRYTPLEPINSEKLPSWLYLLVLENSEFTLGVEVSQTDSQIKVPVIKINNPGSSSVSHFFSQEADAHYWASFHASHAQFSTDELVRPSLERNRVTDPKLTSNVGRLVSPRKLEEDKSYTAFIIPHFEIGRQALLGIPIIPDSNGGGVGTAYIYSPGVVDLESPIPYYYSWQFKTGDDIDFLQLALKIQPAENANILTTVPATIESIGYGLEDLLTNTGGIALEGLMGPPTRDDEGSVFTSSAFENLELMEGIRQKLDEPTYQENDPDPLVQPPLYGTWQADFSTIPEQAVQSLQDDTWDPWMYQVNLDPRYRAVAGIGANVIRANQEYFIDLATRQFAQVQGVNNLISNMQDSFAALRTSSWKHLSLGGQPNPSSDFYLQMYAPTADSILLEGTETSLGTTFQETTISKAYGNYRFKQLTSPRSNKFRKFSGQIKHEVPVAQTINELGLADRKELSYSAFANISADLRHYNLLLEALVLVLTPSEANNNYFPDVELITPGYEEAPTLGFEVHQQLLANYKTYLENSVYQAPEDERGITLTTWPSLDIEGTVSGLLDKLDPELLYGTIASRVGKVKLPNEPEPLPVTLDYIAFTPSFEIPMIDFLLEGYQDLVIPNIEAMPENRLALLAANDKFVESFMIGLNHELAAEFLWRKLPLNKAGTFFRVFWDKRDDLLQDNTQTPDILPIHEWVVSEKLGQNTLSSQASDSITFLIKAELFKYYPDAVLFLRKSKPTDNVFPVPYPPLLTASSTNIPRSEIITPLSRSRVLDGSTVVTFPLSIEEAMNGSMSATPPYDGWFLCIQERSNQTTIGFRVDNVQNTSTPLQLDEFTWNQYVSNPSASPIVQIGTSYSSVQNSAQFAATYLREPAQVYIHLSKFLQ